MTPDGSLRLATRGSDLARRQAASVRERLASPGREVELVEVETTGDRLRDELIHRLGKTGAFVRALDREVLDGDCHAAVHSMKDMPTEFPEGLVVAGVPQRAAAGDVLLTPDGRDLEDLPAEAVVGTSSLRRRAQLLRARPDLRVEPLRGNVDTRLEKLLAPSLQREHERRLEAAGELPGDGDGPEGGGPEDAGDDPEDTEDDPYDRTPQEWFDDLLELERRALERDVETEYAAIVLAEAGLERSGLLEHVGASRLERAQFVPAPGQGAIAVTAADDAVVDRIHQAVDHPPSRVTTTVERTILETLGGGCVAPIGVHALLQGEWVNTRVQVLSTEGEEAVEATRDLPVEDHAEAAREFAADLADRGAADLVEAARREADADEPAKRGEGED